MIKLSSPILNMLLIILCFSALSSSVNAQTLAELDGPSGVGVCTQIPIKLWIDHPDDPLGSFELKIKYDPEQVEFKDGLGIALRPGWILWFMEVYDDTVFLKITAEQSNFIYEPQTRDYVMLLDSFHCIAVGKTGIQIEEITLYTDIRGGGRSISGFQTIDIQIQQTKPVGGTLISVNKIALLTPCLALAGLIAVLSTVYIIKKRKA
jgi:hypothetical protein